VDHWSLTTIREKLVKIGARVVRHARYVTFQLAEVTVPRSLFETFRSLIDDQRRRPAPAQAEKIDSEVKNAGGVRLDDRKNWPKDLPNTVKLSNSDCRMAEKEIPFRRWQACLQFAPN